MINGREEYYIPSSENFAMQNYACSINEPKNP